MLYTHEHTTKQVPESTLQITSTHRTESHESPVVGTCSKMERGDSSRWWRDCSESKLSIF